MEQTIEAHVLQVEKDHGMPLSCSDKIEVGLKDGCDGAGSQTVMKSKDKHSKMGFKIFISSESRIPGMAWEENSFRWFHP